MKNLAFALCASLLVACGGGGGGGGGDATLTVINNSDFVIDQLYLTEVDNPDWGSNLLHNDALFPDEHLVLGVDCDLYDVRLVDEDGVPCTLHDVDLCLNNRTWVIENNTCTSFLRAAQERAAQQSPSK